jgi:hypothetical protein
MRGRGGPGATEGMEGKARPVGRGGGIGAGPLGYEGGVGSPRRPPMLPELLDVGYGLGGRPVDGRGRSGRREEEPVGIELPDKPAPKSVWG